MLSKFPQPVVISVLVVIIIAAIVGGILHVRHATGNDLADQMHAYMKQQKPGQSPFTPQQMQQMSARSGR